MPTPASGVPALSQDPSEPRYGADAVEVTLAASGDAHAFERLYRRHVTRIHNLVRRMHGADDADEVTQDVFVRAWEKLGTFRGESTFFTWLHRLAVNVVLTHREARGRRRSRFSEDEHNPTGFLTLTSVLCPEGDFHGSSLRRAWGMSKRLGKG